MSSRNYRIISLTVLVTCLFAVFTAQASAATHGVVLTAPNSVTPQYGYSWDADGNPLLSLVFQSGTYVTNHDGHVYNCSIVYVNWGWDFFDFQIAPGQTVPWNLVAPYQGQPTVSFQLNCNGSAVGKPKTVRVSG